MSWLSDNLMSIVLLIVLAVIVFFIIRSKIKAKKQAKAVAAAVQGAAAAVHAILKIKTIKTFTVLGIYNWRKDMKLTESKADMQGRIRSVSGDDHFMNRITSIGITEGTAFQTVRNDRKMPVLIYLRETLISLNRADAERIEVETV